MAEINVKITGIRCRRDYNAVRTYFASPHTIECFCRDAKIVEIYEGTKKIEKSTIARELLG